MVGNSFEDKLKELEKAVRRLVDEELSLDQSKLLYTEGIKLAKECNQLLEETELEITELKKELENKEF